MRVTMRAVEMHAFRQIVGKDKVINFVSPSITIAEHWRDPAFCELTDRTRLFGKMVWSAEEKKKLGVYQNESGQWEFEADAELERNFLPEETITLIMLFAETRHSLKTVWREAAKDFVTREFLEI